MEKVIFANMCMIEDGCGRVVVQKRTGTSWNGYAFPGGHVEDGESFADAVRREVREETGLEIEVGEPFNAWTMRAPGRRILGVDFVCRWRSGDVRLSHEHESFAWLTLEEVESRGWEAEPVYRKAFELVEA